MTSPRVHAILATTVAAVHFALAVYGSENKSATYDEMAHVTGGYAYWRLADYRIQPENGNLAQRMIGVPVVLSDAKFPRLDQRSWTTSDFWTLSHQFFFSSGNDAGTMLRSSRRVVAFVGAVLCLVVFFWSRSLWGYAGAWVSLILVAFSPTMLAHAGLATSDVIAAAFFLGALWALWGSLQRQLPWLIAVSALLTAGLFLSKYSALVFVPVAITLLAVRVRARQPAKTPFSLLGLVGIHFVAVIGLIWASYSFRYSAFNPELPPPTQFIDPWSEVATDSSMVGKAVLWSREHRVLPEAYLYGLATVDAYSRNRSAFLNGETSRRGGWRWFFPYAALVKTTLPSLLLLVITPLLVLYERRRTLSDEASAPLPIYQLIPLLVFIGWYWVMAIVSGLNIGHRHLIPVVAATAVVLGAAGAPLSRTWQRLTLRS